MDYFIVYMQERIQVYRTIEREWPGREWSRWCAAPPREQRLEYGGSAPGIFWGFQCVRVPGEAIWHLFAIDFNESINSWPI